MKTLIICRLCLEEDESCLTEYKLNDHLIRLIFTFTTLQVQDSSMKTIYLCSSCTGMLLTFDDFRETCIENDNIFRQKNKESLLINEFVSDQENETLTEEQITAEKKELGKKKGTVLSHSKNLNANASQRQKRVAKIAQSVKKKSGGMVASKTNKTTQHPNVRERSLPCTQCGKMILRHNMKKHMQTHQTDDAPMECCTYCGKPFRCKNLLKVHINSHHTFEQKFECEDCGKVYYRQKSLREHVLTKHTTEKRFECNVCGEKFFNFARRQYHIISVHTTAKPFACQHCDRQFKFKGDLTVHIRTHTGEKPFACDICGKTFSKSYNVVIHKKSHANRLQREKSIRGVDVEEN